ncbi:23S rRNA (adenine(1618)-N(6))-methyltransferase RlmF [Vibrio intestinalis]|uniref:23S rRNA (adenine(1618)-N(6))-methyltransferase RlmF n=1 Tax=Vibrio intestinalis TaxID=2933291 RepID=UPI0021A3DA17|nr:23S rRNA (adenine(1618)-N(6))-methyltransferase RlmF [Vibrio intestinalis]
MTQPKQNTIRQKEKQAETSSTMLVNKIKGKAGLHKRNLHAGRYDFVKLVKALPALKSHIVKTPKGDSIRFDDPTSVKLLNRALLAEYYSVEHWDIPQGYLCPPIPGRADYIHRIAEMLSKEVTSSSQIKMLDVGVGANCIYPIVASTQYGWHCVGSDIDAVSVDNANSIAEKNATLTGRVECRLQTNSRYLFKGIIQNGERYHVTTCNPPFHKSLDEAMQGSVKKQSNLQRNKSQRGSRAAAMNSSKQSEKLQLNFGGQKAELWCPGGEAAFVKNMAFESREFAEQVLWFSTLISKKENVRWLRKNLEKAGAKEVNIVEMSQGQKISRFVAWSFHDKEQRAKWLG